MATTSVAFRWSLRNSLFVVALLLAGIVAAQPLRLMEWNVENMFHPSDNPRVADDAFTPEGEYRWTYGRFMRKATSIAQTVAAVHLPDLIALCEIEDDSTLMALSSYSVMRAAGYRYVCAHGSDVRGINVALFYQPFRFRPISVREVRIPSVENGYRPTRDLLYVAGEVWGASALEECALSSAVLDTLHIIVCHFPSQAGGTREADRHRMLAARTLQALSDSIMLTDTMAAVIVAGDFNSDRHSKVMRYLSLRALPSDFKGTYRYQGDWTHLDHILCSSRVQTDISHVFHPDFLLEENKTYGGFQPCRTFRGTFYHGGVSDHLPIFMDFVLRRR